MLLAHTNGQLAHVAAGHGAQLQHQAFGQVARAHAQGLKLLQPFQCQLQPVKHIDTDAAIAGLRRAHIEHFAHPLSNVFQGIGQVAIAVQRLDEHVQCSQVVVSPTHARELRAKVVLQRHARRVALIAITLAFKIFTACATGGGRRFSDAVEVFAFGAVFPLGVGGGAKFFGAQLGGGLVSVGRIGVVALGYPVGAGGVLRG